MAQIVQHVAAQVSERSLEKRFGGGVGLDHLAVGGDDNDRMRQRVEHGLSGSRGRQK